MTDKELLDKVLRDAGLPSTVFDREDLIQIVAGARAQGQREISFKPKDQAKRMDALDKRLQAVEGKAEPESEPVHPTCTHCGVPIYGPDQAWRNGLPYHPTCLDQHQRKYGDSHIQLTEGQEKETDVTDEQAQVQKEIQESLDKITGPMSAEEIDVIRDYMIPNPSDVPRLIATVDKLREKNHLFLEVLRDMEWVCPYCRATSPRHSHPEQPPHKQGHREGCQLKEALS